MSNPRIIFLFCISFVFSAQCQDNFSESFFSPSKNIQLYIPAFAGLDNKLQSNVIYRSYIGKLSVIRTQYADLNWNLKDLSKNKSRITQHVVGAGFYGDREGDFFNKNRILTRYALHLPLRKQVVLSVGAAMHMINYSFSASGTGTTGSDFTWSGNIGTALSSPSFRIGVSFNDFNNPQIRPINYSFIIHRYTTFYVEKMLPVGSSTFMKGGGRYNQAWGHSSSFLAQLGWFFSREIGFSGFYYINKGWGALFEINKIKLNEENLVDLSFAYQVPTQNHNPPVSQYELNVQYYLKK